MKTTNLELLISGYIREHEDKLELFMNVPQGIHQIMYRLYPVSLFKFGDHDLDGVHVNDDGTILNGNDNQIFYLIYKKIFGKIRIYITIINSKINHKNLRETHQSSIKNHLLFAYKYASSKVA